MSALLAASQASASFFSYASLRFLSASSIGAFLSAGILSPSSASCFSVWKIVASALLSLSTCSLAFLSASAFASASAFMRLISSSESPLEASIRILASLPVALSLAVTLRIPLASISNVTSICGSPRRAGMIPSRWKRPKSLFCAAIGRSPW